MKVNHDELSLAFAYTFTRIELALVLAATAAIPTAMDQGTGRQQGT